RKPIKFHRPEISFCDVHSGHSFTAFFGIGKAGGVAGTRRDTVAVLDVLSLQSPGNRHVYSFGRQELYDTTIRQSRGLTGTRMGLRQAFEHFDEFMQQGLALDAEQEMFEIVIREVSSSARVAPKLNCGNVLFFFSHKMLDSLVGRR